MLHLVILIVSAEIAKGIQYLRVQKEICLFFAYCELSNIFSGPTLVLPVMF